MVLQMSRAFQQCPLADTVFIWSAISKTGAFSVGQNHGSKHCHKISCLPLNQKDVHINSAVVLDIFSQQLQQLGVAIVNSEGLFFSSYCRSAICCTCHS